MSVPNPIPHKTLYINDYICSCYAFVFIFEFSEYISKHILQFHAFFFMYNLILGSRNDIINRMFMEKISAIPKPEIGVRILLSQEVGVKKHNEDFLILTVLFCLFMLCWIFAFLNFIGIDV